MGRLINFENFNRENEVNNIPNVESLNSSGKSFPNNFESDIKLTLQILIHNFPNKINFSMKEAAALLNVGEEFIRRRIKNNKIKIIYFGDKPMIHILELARILAEGI